MFNLFKKSEPKIQLPIHLFNTLSGEKEEFKPHDPEEVTMYTCGPTVYDYAQIGNLAAYTYADMLKRTLLANNYSVRHTMNFTDFGHLSDDGDAGEDKMMRALAREDKAVTLEAMRELSDIYIDATHKDLRALNILPASEYTRASDYIREQVELITLLTEKGYTYETSDGVYFDISKFPTYGKIGNIDLNKLKDGARVEVNSEKQHPADFAVWKKGELGWESDWGKGFPGWHIECTAMAFATLGEQIDIHTGGEDLKYTHHNGEIAQAEAASGHSPYVKYWFHNAYITIDGTKIGKSLGNAITLKELQEKGYTGSAYRYWVLTSHYRSPANFTFDALTASTHALDRLKRYMLEHDTKDAGSISSIYKEKFLTILNNDIDTPGAIALLFEVQKDNTLSDGDKRATLAYMDGVLGLGFAKEVGTLKDELGHIDQDSIPEDIQEILNEREVARIAHNWDEADRLREALVVKGYGVEDTQDGPRLFKD